MVGKKVEKKKQLSYLHTVAGIVKRIIDYTFWRIGNIYVVCTYQLLLTSSLFPLQHGHLNQVSEDDDREARKLDMSWKGDKKKKNW